MGRFFFALNTVFLVYNNRIMVRKISLGILVVVVALLLFLIVMTATGGWNQYTTDETAENAETTPETEVNQTITFGDYQATFDNYKIEDGTVTVHVSVTNNSVNGRAIDTIVGIAVMQAGTQLSKSTNNVYNDSNEATLQEYLDPGQSKTIELKYKMASNDNLFEFEMFNDSSLGLSDQQLGSDLTVKINPTDNTFTTDIYNEANHG